MGLEVECKGSSRGAPRGCQDKVVLNLCQGKKSREAGSALAARKKPKKRGYLPERQQAQSNTHIEGQNCDM
jgi:hypothetical protein